jgi:ribosomal protein S18 acetylase RimI-like enzyme
MLTIRRFQSADHDAVWHLHKLALQESGAFVENGPWDEDLHQIEATYINKGGEFLVGVYEGQVVAMGALIIAGDKAQVKRMRVHPDHQRRGYGQQILQALEQRMRELGYRTIELETTTQQHAAQHFYQKHGYTEIKRTQWRHFTVIHYTKALK